MTPEHFVPLQTNVLKSLGVIDQHIIEYSNCELLQSFLQMYSPFFWHL